MTIQNHKKTISYRDSGVDIDAGDTLVERIKPYVKQTHTSNVLNNLGGFNALFAMPEGYKKPVLVSCTDGVGTKVKLASELNRFNTVGIDLVAMCVNDLIVCGAKPLFFLDYYAMGKLNVDDGVDIVQGIADGCLQAGAALIGGETAEMPGHYAKNDFDLAGFSVGVVEESAIIDGRHITPGNVLIALASSGLHSNGYSLVRKIIEEREISLDLPFNDTAPSLTLGDVLLTPTRIYVKPILELIAQHRVLGLIHITGGGIPENTPRIIPENCQAVIDRSSWEIPELFIWLQNQSQIDDQELFRTFNCGVGMIICVPEEEAEAALVQLHASGETAWRMGKIKSRTANEPAVIFTNPN